MQTVGVTIRLRWLVIPVLLVMAVTAVYAVCHQAGGAVDTIVGMARRITFGALMGVGFWAASHVLQQWMSRSVRPVTPPGPPAPPVPTFMIPTPPGPAQYRVRGIDHDTHFEIEEFIYAESPSNAQLKVELKGVDVAAVDRA